MNNKKTIIEVVVIVGAFLAAGVVLYNGLFKNSATEDPLAQQPKAIEKILPYGDSFKYQQIEEMRKKRFQFGVVSYPEVSSGEVGKTPSELVKSLAPVERSGGTTGR